MIWWSFVYIFAGFALSSASDNSSAVGQSVVPYFRILAPQYLCSSSSGGGNNSDYNPPTSITIALQTRGSERLTYNIQVYFRLLAGFKNQRNTLSVWRSIRLLEKRLRKSKSAISMKNQIDILNEELISGVEYTFSIVGVDLVGNASPAQNFTITYRGASGGIGFDQGTGNSGGDISFLLVGTWSIYRNMPFLLQGVIIFCDPHPYYEFYWTITGLKKGHEEYANTRNKTLFIPEGMLTSGNTHEIHVEVKNNESVLAKASGTLSIIHRDFHLQLVPNNQSTGLNREVVYSVFVDNYEETEDQIKIDWKCFPDSKSSGNCQKGSPRDIWSVSYIFSRTGLYQIQVSVTLNGVTKNDTAYIEIHPEVIVSVEVISIEPFEVVSEHPFSARARINYLIPQCSAEWHSVATDDRYKYLHISDLEQGLGKMTMHDLEENFLSELIEFENDTTSYELQLDIPGTSDVFTGLVGSTEYLFRLVITCPAPFDYTKEDNITSHKNVTNYVDLIIRANEPPFVEHLDVDPKNGTAMKTLFKLSTAPAVDAPGDYPMRYRFYYGVDDFWVLIGDFYENSVTTAELPFSEKKIRTKYEVCDSRNACATVHGPDIHIEPIGTITAGEMELRLNSLNGSMLRKDYDEFFERSVCLLWSVNDRETQKMFDTITDIMEMEINSLSKRTKLPTNVLDGWRIIAKRIGNEKLQDQINNQL